MEPTDEQQLPDSIEITNDNAKGETRIKVKIRSIRNVPGVDNRSTEEAAKLALDTFNDLVQKTAKTPDVFGK